jgi:hypothetical protein
MGVFTTRYDIASNKIFCYGNDASMESDPSDPTPPQDIPSSSGSKPILDRIQKQRTDRPSGSQRKIREQQLRVVDQPEPTPEIQPTIVEEEKKRRHFEGKSIEYTIDEIMQNPTATGDTLEKGWGEKQGKIPAGFVAVIVGFLICVAAIVYQLIDHDQEMITSQTPVDQIVTEEAVARELIKSIESTVRSYLAATSIEEKMRYVRHPQAMQPRMEAFYQATPLAPQPCELVTKMRPLALEGRPFWQVLAIIDQTRGEALLLEQISDTKVLIDWESHVNYQPVPWSQYVQAPTTVPMSFRVVIEESPRYLGEFMDESRWASYRLSNPGTEDVLYGYVLRDSAVHRSLLNAQAKGSQRMILRLQSSPEFKARQSVVIKALISEDIYRIDAPTSLTD